VVKVGSIQRSRQVSPDFSMCWFDVGSTKRADISGVGGVWVDWVQIEGAV
jgi:hypothetical protein